MRRIIALFIIIVVFFITACASSAKTTPIPVTLPPSQTPFRPTIFPIPTLTPTDVPVGITEIANLGKGSAEFVDWSPDGKLYAIGGSFGIYLYDAKMHVEIKFLPYPVANGIRFSPDSKLIQISGWNDIKIVGIKDGKILDTAKGSFLFGATFSQDSHLYAFIERFELDSSDTIHVRKVDGPAEMLTVYTEPYPKRVFYNQVLFDRTGTLLYVAAPDNLIYVWDISTSVLKYTLKGHTNEVMGFVFSPDGKLLASYGKDFRIFVWDIKTRQRFRTIVGYKGTVKKLTFSPDGSQLNIIFDDNSMLVRDLATGKTINTGKYVDSDATLLQELRSNGGYIDYIRGLTYSPDGQTLAVSSSGSAPILLWDIHSKKVRATLNAKASNLLYSHTGDFLASFDDDYGESEVSIWDTHTNGKIRSLEAPYVHSIAFSPDDSTLAVGTKGKIDLWDFQQGILAKTIIPKGEWILFISYSPDGKTLSSVSTTYISETYTSDFFVQSWNVSTGNLVHEYIPSDNNLGTWGEIIGFRNDTLVKFEYLGSFKDNTAELWDINTGKRTHILTGVNDYASHTLVFAPNAQVVAICYTYGINFYDTSTGQTIYIYDKEAHYGAALSFSPDGNFLVIGDAEGNIVLWDVSRIIQASSGINP